MVAGRPPFHGENHIDLLRNIQRRAVRLPPGVQISTECINLLRILLNRNPTRRATFDQFLEASHEFIKLGCNGSTPILIEPVTCTQSHSLGNIRQSMQATPHLHKISEESPLSESIPGDNCPDHDSQKNLQLAKHSSFTTFSSRNSLQVTADHERILTSNAAKVFSTNTVSPFEQTNFLAPGSLPLTKKTNQAVSHISPLVARYVLVSPLNYPFPIFLLTMRFRTFFIVLLEHKFTQIPHYLPFHWMVTVVIILEHQFQRLLRPSHIRSLINYQT